MPNSVELYPVSRQSNDARSHELSTYRKHPQTVESNKTNSITHEGPTTYHGQTTVFGDAVQFSGSDWLLVKPEGMMFKSVDRNNNKHKLFTHQALNGHLLTDQPGPSRSSKIH